MNERPLRSECDEFSAAYEAGITSVCRRYDDQTPEVTLASESARLDVLAAVLRRDSMAAPGAARMSDDERAIMLEILADTASVVRRLAQLNEAYVTRLQSRDSARPPQL
ncbi:hypothetical protein K6W16_10480 [Burkholderia dolosa]|uniref:Uncharacterized protein n=1 Tax=Burkholderia dolosa TaxID=152500 RepID=A0A892I6K1_9BURK|nr:MULTISPECIES: hypothetical protein [Burkholderia]AJY12056.1 hypothetical protein AK34_707 [Burkholderia dolosa AU0158]MBR8419822.1 hypothetical protein [Burkholderia dolosa]MBY4657920.1 hypothetical protein [Burkholderia dolosa]MBY4690059.1 hypothetical protein [Burkholderia dolosa]MBY4782797.1 hypothetical protein [Burkholderia dolosa]